MVRSGPDSSVANWSSCSCTTVVHSRMAANAPAALLSSVPAVQPAAPQARLTTTAMPNPATRRPTVTGGLGTSETDPVCVTAIARLNRPETANVSATLTTRATVTASAWPTEVRALVGSCSNEVLMVPPAQLLPAASAPMRKNAAVPARVGSSPMLLSTAGTNWPGRIVGRTWDGVARLMAPAPALRYRTYWSM